MMTENNDMKILTAEETELSKKFELWLKQTLEPFDRWEYDGKIYRVYAAGRETEIYEPALVRELVRGI